MKGNIKFLVHAATIAALYVVLTQIAAMFGLSSSAIQLRFSEALTILPIFTPAAIPGLFIGCILSNLLSGCVFWDIVFGSIATLIGAIGTFACRKHERISILPPIISNTVIIPFVLRYAYGIPGSFCYFVFTVGIGEILSCGVLGFLLLSTLKKTKIF